MNWINLLNNIDRNKIIYKEYNSNDLIFNEQTKCNMLAIITKGEVLISTITHNEKEEIFNTISENDAFGDILVFTTSSKYLGNVIATKKTKIAFIKKEILLDVFSKHPLILDEYLKHIADKSIKIKLQSKLLSHKNIEDRIMYYLSILSEDDSYIYIKSVTDLSKTLSLPRPSVSRSLTNLEDKGLITRNGKYIKINN